MLSRKSTLVLLVAMVLIASVMFFVAAAPASAQRATPAPIQLTATPTETAFPTATAVPPTATKVPPTATKVPPTATATKVPPTATATKVPPTPTKVVANSPKAPGTVPGPAGTFNTAFTIQNLGASIASCSYQFFNGSGTAIYSSSTFTISVGGSNFTYVPSIGGLASGQYSGVVSCDQQVTSVVDMSTSPVAGSSAGAYRGIDGSSVGTTFYAPLAMNNYYNLYTNFVVQNASSSPVNIYVNIINSAGTTVLVQTATSVAANASASFDQTGQGAMGTNVLYSALITSTGNIAVEANQYGNGGSVTGQLYSYNPLTGGSTLAYAPLIANNYYGYNTALQVQNLSASASTVVTVTYGTGLTQSWSLGPTASHSFYSPVSGLPSGTLTSAKVQSSGQPIVVEVNESNNYNRASSYTGFPSGTTTVRAPIVLRRYYSNNTSVTCQNLGGSSTTMTITYSNGNSTVSPSVASNGTYQFYQPADSAIPNGFNGSATITTASQPIVCVVNQDLNEAPYGTMLMDQMYAYEGTNQ